MNTEQLEARMIALKDFIRDAQIRMESGAMPDFSALERDVSQICQAALALPPEQARAVQPVMADLIGDLERLATGLKDYRNKRK